LPTSLVHGYQWRAADFVEKVLKCALFVDMGLGKTLISLTALARLLDNFMIDKTLIVAPLNVANDTWPHEIPKWQHTKHLTCAHITGNPKQRAKALQNECEIDVISITNLVWLVDHYGKKWPYSTLIIDESSMFKDRTTKRFKKLRRVVQKCVRVVELTGTPTSNGLLDLWPQIYLLDQGQRLGKTFKAFTDEFFHTHDKGDYKTYTLKKGADEIIYKRIEDICLTLDAKDYLEIKEPIHIVRKIQLPRKLREMYAELEKEMVLELNKDHVEANFAADLTNKLLQFCNGAPYFENKSYEVIHNLKLDILDEVIESMNGKPLLIAYSFISDRERILKAYPEAVHFQSGQGIREKWNRGEIPLLVLHPASAGHGLDFQDGGNVLFWFGLTHSLELFQQLNERMGPVRQKQSGHDRPSIYYEVVVEDTVDEMVLERLASKNKTQRSLLEALRVDLNKRVKL